MRCDGCGLEARQLWLPRCCAACWEQKVREPGGERLVTMLEVWVRERRWMRPLVLQAGKAEAISAPVGGPMEAGMMLREHQPDLEVFTFALETVGRGHRITCDGVTLEEVEHA